MAKSSVTYVCGCGYRTRKSSEAEEHCDTKGHTMFVSGSVQPNERAKAVPNRSRVSMPQPVAQSAQSGPSDLEKQFNALRAKLRPQG